MSRAWRTVITITQPLAVISHIHIYPRLPTQSIDIMEEIGIDMKLEVSLSLLCRRELQAEADLICRIPRSNSKSRKSRRC